MLQGSLADPCQQLQQEHPCQTATASGTVVAAGAAAAAAVLRALAQQEVVHVPQQVHEQNAPKHLVLQAETLHGYCCAGVVLTAVDDPMRHLLVHAQQQDDLQEGRFCPATLAVAQIVAPGHEGLHAGLAAAVCSPHTLLKVVLFLIYHLPCHPGLAVGCHSPYHRYRIPCLHHKAGLMCLYHLPHVYPYCCS